MIEPINLFVQGIPGMIQAAVVKALSSGATSAQLAPVTAAATLIQSRMLEITAAMKGEAPFGRNPPQ